MASIKPLLLSSIVAALTFGASAQAEVSIEREFALKVFPLLKSKCFACHGDDPEKIKGDLNMLSREHMLEGSENSDTILVPGNAEESDLYIAATWEDPDMEMPPKENDRLNEEQLAVLKRWIDAGAPWVEEERRAEFFAEERTQRVTDEGMIIGTSGGLGDEWTYRRYKPEDVWAFQPVTKPEPPSDGHPIDAFIDAKRKVAGIEEPAALAESSVLVRRIFLDLTGLPPTPAQVGKWQPRLDTQDEAKHQAAVGELVEELLASPHYGERWAQHWLDVVRYADTGGYSNDYERSNAWRYRDYVIRAFNEDKPYDQFVLEQIAGDELADESARKRLGDDRKLAKARESGEYTSEESEYLVATGFLRMGAWDNAMVKAPEARQIFLDDVVNTVGQSFLATTMRCFKCHDHKFDPLPTRDYYRLYAAFAGTQMAERPVPFLDDENRHGFEESKEEAERLLAYATKEKKRIKKKQEDAARAWFKENNLPYLTEQERKDLPDEQKPPRYVGLDYIDEGQLKVREQDEWIWNRRLERYEPMAQTVYNGPDKGGSARKLRMGKKKDPKWRPDSRILMGGALEAADEPVTPGVLSAIALPVDGAPSEDAFALPETLEGRRTALAKWIAHPSNPLTTRSIVNRLWQYHFFKPIAGNPNNFGVKGAKPTHPQLLDWLASDFVANGWTIKRMHKLIMTSRAYRQAASHPQMAKLQSQDPNNDLLAFFPQRRLTAEEFRDSLLTITGELNPALGGLPIKPEINMEVALQPRMIQFSIAPAYQPSPLPEHRNRRTVYAYRVRGLADPFLELFNQPSPNESCDMRDSAAVTPQAFTLLNSDVITDRSIALALSLEKESEDLEAQIKLGFVRTLGREPNTEEHEHLLAYVKEMRDYHAGVTVEPATYPTKITRSLVEEFSGKPFEYEEILPAFENYKPDTKAADVGADTRALADFCLMLFNTNEFAYVY